MNIPCSAPSHIKTRASLKYFVHDCSLNMKKTLKEAVRIRHTLLDFFAAATFEDFELFVFRHIKKTFQILWSSLSGFAEKRTPKNYCLWEVNLFSYLFSFIWKYVKLKDFTLKHLFTFWDMRTWVMWKVFLQTYRNNTIW